MIEVLCCGDRENLRSAFPSPTSAVSDRTQTSKAGHPIEVFSILVSFSDID
jgi:hypothetical protein